MPTALKAILWAALGLAVTAASSQDQPPEGNEGPEPVPSGPTKVALNERLPELEAADWANYDGRPTLEKLKDRIVVLFFFRTDDTSAESIPTLNEVYKTFHQLGVVVIGLTPQKRDVAESVVRGKQIKFIVGYGARTDQRYEVSSFPKVYLLDTAGRLVNRFHPGEELEDKIRAQMLKTPPAGADPQTLRRRYEQAIAAQKANELGRAYTLARGVTKLAGKESDIGKKATELVKQTEEGARKWLEEAKTAAKADDHDKACRLLAELSVRFAGEQIGADADTEIGRLMGNRELKPKIRKAMDNAKGQLLNDQAADHEASARYLEALKLYREVTEDYASTEASEAAEKAIERINGDPKAQETIRSLWADEEAERWLDIADRFAKVGMYDKAREFYQRIADTHPTARAAPRAKERMAKLPEEKPEEELEPPPEEEASPPSG
jgi:peroxiredoxin